MVESVYRTEILNKEVTVKCLKLEYGHQILICGGDLSHVGSVSVIDEKGVLKTIDLPEHKEAIISEKWARRVHEATKEPVAVTAGIHFDRLDKKDISLIISEMERLLEKVVCSDFLSGRMMFG